MSLSVRIKEKFCEINDFYASPSPTEVFCDRMVLPGNLLLFSYSPPWAMLSVFPYRSLLPSCSNIQIPRLLNQRSAFSGSGALTQDSAISVSRSVDGYTGDWNKSSGLPQVWKEIILLSSLHKKLIVLPRPIIWPQLKRLYFIFSFFPCSYSPLGYVVFPCVSFILWTLLEQPLIVAACETYLISVPSLAHWAIHVK